ncbi:hypothetical protein PFDG_05214, partial [Plasmodium falciparum Dd2]
KSTPEQVTTRVTNDLQEKKRKRPRSVLLPHRQKNLEKAEKNSDENQRSHADKEAREGKRVPRSRVRITSNLIYASIIEDYTKYVLCSTCSRDATLSKILGPYRRKPTNRVIKQWATIKSAWGNRARFDRPRPPYAGKGEALAGGSEAG